MRWKAFVAKVLYWPVRWLTRFETIFDENISAVGDPQHVVYVMRSTSITDLIVANRALKKAGLPELFEPLLINGERHARVMFLEQAKADTNEAAIDEFLHLLKSHQKERQLDVQLAPIGLFWGA